MKDGFYIMIETMHYGDRGTSENVSQFLASPKQDEPLHKKNNNMHGQKERKNCFRYTDSTIPILFKSEISS